jgi:hypothetical protein
MVLDGPVTGDALRGTIEQVLVPLRARGRVVIMDHPRAHRAARIHETIEVRLRYLQPCLPCTDPTGNAFCKFKPLLRKAAARTIDGLRDAIPDAPLPVPPAACVSDVIATGSNSGLICIGETTLL